MEIMIVDDEPEVAEVLAKRPRLALTVHGAYETKVDGEALRRSRHHGRVHGAGDDHVHVAERDPALADPRDGRLEKRGRQEGDGGGPDRRHLYGSRGGAGQTTAVPPDRAPGASFTRQAEKRPWSPCSSTGSATTMISSDASSWNIRMHAAAA